MPDLERDGTGNLTSDGRLRYVYDVYNRLVRVLVPAGGELCRYGYTLGSNLRSRSVGAATEEYDFADGRLWQVREGTTVKQAYLFHSRFGYYAVRFAGGGTETIESDAEGVRSVTNLGQAGQHFTYDTNGKVMVDPPDFAPLVRVLWKGWFYDGLTELHYHDRKWYHPATGTPVNPNVSGPNFLQESPEGLLRHESTEEQRALAVPAPARDFRVLYRENLPRPTSVTVIRGTFGDAIHLNGYPTIVCHGFDGHRMVGPVNSFSLPGGAPELRRALELRDSTARMTAETGLFLVLPELYAFRSAGLAARIGKSFMAATKASLIHEVFGAAVMGEDVSVERFGKNIVLFMAFDGAIAGGVQLLQKVREAAMQYAREGVLVLALRRPSVELPGLPAPPPRVAGLRPPGASPPDLPVQVIRGDGVRRSSQVLRLFNEARAARAELHSFRGAVTAAAIDAELKHNVAVLGGRASASSAVDTPLPEGWWPNPEPSTAVLRTFEGGTSHWQHTEWKILETLIQEGQVSRGDVLLLFTERPPCGHCRLAIRVFEELYGVTIRVVDAGVPEGKAALESFWMRQFRVPAGE